MSILVSSRSLAANQTEDHWGPIVWHEPGLACRLRFFLSLECPVTCRYLLVQQHAARPPCGLGIGIGLAA